MSQLRGQQQQQQRQLCTPGKQPLSPQADTSLITSAVRKRKGEDGLRACGQAARAILARSSAALRCLAARVL